MPTLEYSTFHFCYFNTIVKLYWILFPKCPYNKYTKGFIYLLTLTLLTSVRYNCWNGLHIDQIISTILNIMYETKIWSHSYFMVDLSLAGWKKHYEWERMKCRGHGESFSNDLVWTETFLWEYCKGNRKEPAWSCWKHPQNSGSDWLQEQSSHLCFVSRDLNQFLVACSLHVSLLC